MSESRWRPYVALGLLTLGLCLQGAKNPLTFFIWASVSLSLWVWLILERPGAFSKSFSGPLIGFLVCLAASWIFSTDPSTSLLPTLQIVTAILTFLMLKNSAGALPEKTFWRWLFVLGVATLLRTLYQIKTGPNALGLFETYGFLPSNPSFNAIWMCSLAVAFSTHALLRKRTWEPEDIAEILLAAGLAFLVVVNPARTRSAPLALAVGLFYALCVRFSFKRVAIGGVLFIGLALTLLPASFLEAHARISGKYAEPNYRSQIWGVAVQSTQDRPLTGYGLGNFEMGYQKHAFPVEQDFVRYARTTEFAHNEYLQVAADLGVPAFFLFLFFILTAFRTPTNRFPEKQIPAKAALLALCCDAFFTPAWHVPFLVYVTLFWAYVLSPAGQTPPPEQRMTPSRRPWIYLGTGLLFLSLECMLGYSALQWTWAKQNNWQAILRINPRDGSAWTALGDQSSVPADAVRAQRKAVQSVPDQPYFHEALAFALERSGTPEDLAEALQEYRAAFVLAPRRALYALAIGRHLFRMGDAASALVWFKVARRLEPHYWESYLWTSRALAATGNRGRAQWMLRHLPIEHAAFLGYQREVVSHLTRYQPSGYERMILSYNADVVQVDLQKLTR